MIVDARKQYEKEPKSFGNKRNRMTEAHRAWIDKRYRDGWKKDYTDEHVKIFRNTTTEKDFAYHKVSVVFWQFGEDDQPALVTEEFPVQFNSQNVKKRQEFYDSEIALHIKLSDPKSKTTRSFDILLQPNDAFTEIYRAEVERAFDKEIESLIHGIDSAKERNRAVKRFIDSLDCSVSYTHRHYIKDDEYIPYGDDIEAFLRREIERPIIRWEDRPQLGYEILPNKYFYRYVPPTPAKELLVEFWNLEKQAEQMLTGLAK
jgi:type I restriction enzyme M protein